MFQSDIIYPIGVDISDHDVFVSQLKRRRKGLVLRDIFHQELNGLNEDPSEADDLLIASLKQISKRKGFSGKKVAIHLPFEKVISFPIRFEAGKEESLEEAIIRESNDFLPFPIEQAIIDYPSLDPIGDDDSTLHRATIIALKREDLDHYLRLIKKSGLAVETIDFPVSSLMRLHEYLHDESQQPVILCHIGNKHSHLAGVTGDSIIFHRTLPLGVENLTSRILNSFELPDQRNKGKLILEQYGLAYEEHLLNKEKKEDDYRSDHDMYRAVYQIITPYIEGLIDEFHKIIGYLRSEDQNAFFEGIYIYGQGAMIQSLDTYIEKQMNIPTRRVDPFQKFDLQEGPVTDELNGGMSFALSLGLAMRRVPWL
ncbi:MAG: type IV pilus assembly protein PilM [Deltaproteobacteria bacterium]|nr:type IV pilus assembly protein PilM [Deltaproteobacteria bacterium]